MKTTIDSLFDARDLLDGIEAEYERDPILVSNAVVEALEAIDEAIRIVRGDAEVKLW